jgi:outer membrane protein OmpA-like peptidoglycan-associated protein
MTLLEALDGLATPQLLSKLSGQLGEPESTVRSSLRMAFPTLLAGLLAKASDPGFLRQLTDLLGDAAVDPRIADDPGAVVTAAQPSSSLGNLATRFLSSSFGGRLDTVTSQFGAAAGLRTGTAGSLLRLATPLVMSALASRVRGGGLSALTSLLTAERSSITAALPAGIGQAIGIARGPASAATPEYERARGLRWLWPIAAALAVFAAWSLLQRSSTPQVESVMMVREETGTVDRTLPGNVRLSVPKTGLENELIVFLEQNRPIEPATWFNFDRLLFDTGKATLRPESRAQLANVAEILKAYPAVTVKIGGYTDNVGEPSANLALSQARATNVANELATLGVGAERLSAEGYGEQHPVADNTTDAGRAQNRRIALRVTAR